ncbi:unnamed protein product [Protopolystoma xenopodis]|uniref:Uncharacterized protein n=1 Tax=Protopolystoma xenopodis TaxID=117903 RepID=A0A448XHT0_9PLAT|nr:unnamed protein product [Protopolystoma xenopodis]
MPRLRETRMDSDFGMCKSREDVHPDDVTSHSAESVKESQESGQSEASLRVDRQKPETEMVLSEDNTSSVSIKLGYFLLENSIHTIKLIFK